MQNSKRVTGLWLMALCMSPAAMAFENDAYEWIISGRSQAKQERPQQKHRLGSTEPRVFDRIRETGNDSAPDFAAGQDAALITAAAQNDLLGVMTLLKNGANPNVQDKLGNRPLLHAARLGATEMARQLLEEGADPNVKGMGYTPLGLAALNGHPRIADWLLQFGADVDKRSDNGLTPLMNAALLNNIGVIKEILRYDTEIDRENNAGRTALSYAAEGGAEQAIELLLGRGADVNAVDHKFNAPLFWAASRDQRSAIRLLLRHGAETGAVSLDLL